MIRGSAPLIHSNKVWLWWLDALRPRQKRTHRPPAVATAVDGRGLLLLGTALCQGCLLQLQNVVQLKLHTHSRAWRQG